MGIFSKKEMDTCVAKAFWNWFSENEQFIIEKYKTDGMGLVEIIDEKLKLVFPYFKRELEFQLGYNDGKGEFFFFYLHNKNLKADGRTLGEMMPEELKENWTYFLEAQAEENE